ncbi:homoserine dehydrogenase [Pontibacter aydingkolensis]|uniref:Homoserine dehydrogenase n=1 Tax=Pontibacter aydingkolensis TaxID=1911536 RepID=A0ABS7CY53_9BACT|nr:homoserine dehydrogenase [Pontibacter aydingkolensis]MBW7468798.1 homoserine dehydrogenase [Pontibacter aydingkolensis]
MKRKELNIGLFGFGCVGYGLFEVLHKTPGLKTTIKKICVKQAGKARPIPAENFTLNKYDILDDPSINVVVELIDDADAAFEIVSEALKKGKAVVSANKKMIAEHFNELLELQRLYNAPLLYEAACCASIPIIRNLEEYYDTDLLTSVEGIVNGSCNYILSRIFSDNLDYTIALAEAQAQGYAESDPSLDTGGSDAKYKLLLLIAHAFGLVLNPEDIFTLGIDRIGNTELQYAREKGYKIKLVAQAIKNADNSISFFVIPKFVSPDSRLYAVDDAFNGVITHTSFAETQFFVGKGAGAYPTASAVLSDLSALTYDYRYEYKKLHQVDAVASNEDRLLSILLTGSHDLSLYFDLFKSIEETCTRRDGSYVIGTLTLSSLKLLIKEPTVSVVLRNIEVEDKAEATAVFAGVELLDTVLGQEI